MWSCTYSLAETAGRSVSGQLRGTHKNGVDVWPFFHTEKEKYLKNIDDMLRDKPCLT